MQGVRSSWQSINRSSSAILCHPFISYLLLCRRCWSLCLQRNRDSCGSSAGNFHPALVQFDFILIFVRTSIELSVSVCFGLAPSIFQQLIPVFISCWFFLSCLMSTFTILLLLHHHRRCPPLLLVIWIRFPFREVFWWSAWRSFRHSGWHLSEHTYKRIARRRLIPKCFHLSVCALPPFARLLLFSPVFSSCSVDLNNPLRLSLFFFAVITWDHLFMIFTCFSWLFTTTRAHLYGVSPSPLPSSASLFFFFHLSHCGCVSTDRPWFFSRAYLSSSVLHNFVDKRLGRCCAQSAPPSLPSACSTSSCVSVPTTASLENCGLLVFRKRRIFFVEFSKSIFFGILFNSDHFCICRLI